MEKPRRGLKYAHEKASEQSKKEKARFKKMYDTRCKAVELRPSDLVLVQVTVFKGRHKIHDRWEPVDYRVISKNHPNVPVYRIEAISGGKPRVLYRNLLLPIGQILEDDHADDDEEELSVAIPVKTKPKVSFSDHIDSMSFSNKHSDNQQRLFQSYTHQNKRAPNLISLVLFCYPCLIKKFLTQVHFYTTGTRHC